MRSLHIQHCIAKGSEHKGGLSRCNQLLSSSPVPQGIANFRFHSKQPCKAKQVMNWKQRGMGARCLH